MCGITGIVSKARITPRQTGLVAQLNALLTHRGPDGEGAIQGDHVSLAMRRLSIIDLSTGWQPLYNEDRTLALICNGEIYNFIELRKMLEGRGHRFATRSDCETILHLYEDHGDECVHHLRGMYAFALWDSRRRRLLLVRDRMGEKPLYLVERGEGDAKEIIFSSELRALVQAGVVDLELDPGAVHEYFHYGYVPEPRSPLLGVRKLPAGHLLSVEVDSWTVRERCYWRIEDAPPLEGDPPALIREELERISDLIIRSDVPVGVALSGGLDSSVIATLAQKKYPGTMEAITIGYAGMPWQDERPMARELARHLNMPLHEVELSCDDMVRSFPQMVFQRDEPIADLSGIGYWSVMQRARQQNLLVMLAGQGGDELFWGYPWVRQAAAFNRRKEALHSAGKVGLRDYLSVTKPPISYSGGLRWLKSMGGLRSGLRQWREDRNGDAGRMVFYELESIFREAMQRTGNLYGPQFAERALQANPLHRFVASRPWPNIEVAMIRFISETYLRQNGIAQSDRLSMAWSVELRLPLVDYRLVELVVGLTKTYGHSGLPPKQWLRDAVRDIVPAFVMQRRKRGFSPPWRQWHRALRDTYGKQLLDGFLVQRGVLSAAGARSLGDGLSPSLLAPARHLSERALILELWCQQMDEASPEKPPATGSAARQAPAAHAPSSLARVS